MLGNFVIGTSVLAPTGMLPELAQAFEMPLDYDAAPSSPSPSIIGPIDRGTVVAAVERYLASRGIAVAAPTSGPSCSRDTPSAAKPIPQSTSATAGVAADVVDRFLARRGSGANGGFG